MTARELCEGVRNGDKAAEEELAVVLRQNQGEYFREQCPDDADDLLQELWIMVRRRILEDGLKHPQWVHTYAGTCARDLIRQARNRKRRVVQIQGMAIAA